MRPALQRAFAPFLPGVDRFGVVLVLLVLSFLSPALGGSSGLRLVEVSCAVVALWLALRESATSPRLRLAAAGVLTLTLIAAVIITQTVADNTARGLGELWFVVVLLLTLIAVLRRILIHQEVTLETIYGALSAYLLIGLMFSAVYGAMEYLGNQQLFTQVAEPSFPLRQYFSFATLTTLGYGDVTAATDIGRAVAILEAICGQIFLVTLIARLVANFAGRRPNP